MRLEEGRGGNEGKEKNVRSEGMKEEGEVMNGEKDIIEPREEGRGEWRKRGKKGEEVRER